VATLCVEAAAVLVFWDVTEEVLARDGDAVTVTVTKTGPKASLVGSPGVCVTVTVIVSHNGIDVLFADTEELNPVSVGEVDDGFAIEVSMVDSGSGESAVTVTSIVCA
jgi:hypothetical protein